MVALTRNVDLVTGAGLIFLAVGDYRSPQPGSRWFAFLACLRVCLIFLSSRSICRVMLARLCLGGGSFDLLNVPMISLIMAFRLAFRSSTSSAILSSKLQKSQ